METAWLYSYYGAFQNYIRVKAYQLQITDQAKLVDEGTGLGENNKNKNIANGPAVREMELIPFA